MSARSAMLRRSSTSKVGDLGPTTDEIVEALEAARTVADHGTLNAWRVIELRGDDRERLGDALGRADGAKKPSSKPLRAPVLLAIVSCRVPSKKAPDWEQDVTAAGVAHNLGLLLDEAGWGVIWRTGSLTNHPEVRAVHGLGEREFLLGWLYVGNRLTPAKPRSDRREAASFLSRLP